LVLVSGYSGIGKSSVVDELHKVLVPPRGLFASGKFDQYKRDIPYATLVQAFQSLVRPLLSKSDTRHLRGRCRRARSGSQAETCGWCPFHLPWLAATTGQFGQAEPRMIEQKFWRT
jgi:hypothetical protein